MASQAMRARFAAKAAAAAGDGEAAVVDSTDVAGGIDTGGEESADTSHVTETAEGAAPAVEAKTEADAPAEPETPEQADAKARAARLALYEEKLKGQREKRQAQRLIETARAERKAAQDDRDAAKAERAKYDGLKTGSYKETLEALGRDPRKTFEEMQREAIEASTPEAQARRDKADAERALEERFKPVLSELEQLREERKLMLAERAEHHISTSFQKAAADSAFADLRIEYPDEALLDHAKHYDKHPDQLRAAAVQFGVRLTAPEKGFTMHELLQVLSAAQAAHNAGVQARRAAQRPAEPQSAAPPTVNGTAPRRNAAANGNELASSRAPGKAETSSLSPRDRLRQRSAEEIRRNGGLSD